MNTLTIILAMLAVIVMMGAVIFALLKDRKSQKKETEKLQDKLTSANENLYAMKHYIEQILAIKSDTQTNVEKIKEAKTDEEVLNILSDIISANNNRVQND
jgi:preprotein translocase subunit YajC